MDKKNRKRKKARKALRTAGAVGIVLGGGVVGANVVFAAGLVEEAAEQQAETALTTEFVEELGAAASEQPVTEILDSETTTGDTVETTDTTSASEVTEDSEGTTEGNSQDAVQQKGHDNGQHNGQNNGNGSDQDSGKHVIVKSRSKETSRSAEWHQHCGSLKLQNPAGVWGVIGEQLFGPVTISQKQLRCLLQHPEQISVGIQPVLLGGLDQTVDHSTGLGAQRGVGKEEILPSDYKRLDTALGPVVAQLQPPVLQITQEVRPLFSEIVQCLAQRRFWGHRA